MRLAALADIHGNLPALEAVLAEVDEESFDGIVVCGDVLVGPFPGACLAVLRARPEPTYWIKGNCEREVIETYDARSDVDGGPAANRRHSASELTAADRDEIAGWPIALVLDDVCFCHGSPRSEDEVLTRGTPEPILRAAVAAAVPLVVGGHTHQQMVRALEGCADYANTGSIGRPYEGEAAAFWMVVDGGVPEPRRTGYDLAAALGRLRETEFPETEDYIDGALEPLIDPTWVTTLFESGAGRGADPGPPLYLA
jgi:putative phosphoesterase